MVELEITKLFVVRGEPEMVAMTVYALLEMMRTKHDLEEEKKAKREMEILEKLGGMSMEELLKAERGDTNEEEKKA